jgi:hypothetical protein
LLGLPLRGFAQGSLAAQHWRMVMVNRLNQGLGARHLQEGCPFVTAGLIMLGITGAGIELDQELPGLHLLPFFDMQGAHTGHIH